MAGVGLFDMDPASPGYGERVPFSLEITRVEDPDGTGRHVGILFVGTMLREAGTYALVVTRRVHAAREPGRPFGPSLFFEQVAASGQPGESLELSRARLSLGPALDFLESVPEVPIPREDVALALRVSIRSRAFESADLVAVKEAALAAAPPTLEASLVAGMPMGGVAVLGNVELPFYLDPSDLTRLSRDPATGRPLPTGSEAVPFVLTLPPEAEAGPVPVVIYQHGSPGGPLEILEPQNLFLHGAGYAVVGIQDVRNRRFGSSSPAIAAALFTNLLVHRHLPLDLLQTYADLFGLLRAIEGQAARSLLPLGMPDDVPEVDSGRILFRGFSQGSSDALAVLPLAPEITAAVLLVGAGRSFEQTLHQVTTQDVLREVARLLPGARPVDVIVELAILQNDADRQDSIYMARHLYREPLPVAWSRREPPSLLFVEGIGDTFITSGSSRAAARDLGIPQVNALEASPLLEQVRAPLAGNLARGLTGGHFQYDPARTPSCIEASLLDGHFCPTLAPEAQRQTLHFFATALEGRAEIIDPLAPGSSPPRSPPTADGRSGTGPGAAPRRRTPATARARGCRSPPASRGSR
jgi:hypothetical protein